MTMQITPSRPSLAMYGKTLAETVAVKDWMMRRLDKSSIPASSLAADLQKWGVNPLGEQTAIRDWEMRRLNKRRIPASSLLGIGSLAAHVGTRAERRWGINPLAESTYVRSTEARRVGKQRYLENALNGFGALDSEVSTREVQTVLRKLGICASSDGRRMAIDNKFGPITEDCLKIAVRRVNGEQATSYAGYFVSVPSSQTVALDTTFWTRLNQLAEGRVDNCSVTSTADSTAPITDSAGEDSGVTSDEGGSSWLMSPWTWLAAAVVVGGAYMVYNAEEDGMGGDWANEGY